VSTNIFAISGRVNQAFAQSFGNTLGNEVPLKRFAITAVGAQVSVPVAGSCRKRKHLDKQLIAPRAAILVFLHDLNSTIFSRRTRSGRACARPTRIAARILSSSSISSLFFGATVMSIAAAASCSAAGNVRTILIASSSILVMIGITPHSQLSTTAAPPGCQLSHQESMLMKNKFDGGSEQQTNPGEGVFESIMRVRHLL
jgi:hypothetical protein